MRNSSNITSDVGIELNKQICEHIRNRIVYISSKHIGTIAPQDAKETLSHQCGRIQIKANSSGPFSPSMYFSLPRDKRILFIIMEPYLHRDAYDHGDRGGHNQAVDFSKAISEHGWSGLESATYKNLAKIVYSIETNELFTNTDEVRAEAARILLSNAAIININPFPCICGVGSNRSLISQWAKENRGLISEQIELYDAGLIYCGGVGYDCFQARSNKEGYFGPYRMSVLPYPKVQQVVGYPVFNNRDFFYNAEHLVINGYHPSRLSYKNLNGIGIIDKFWGDMTQEKNTNSINCQV